MEVAVGATIDATPEVWWLVDRLGGGKDLSRGNGKISTTIYYDYDRMGRGGGILYLWQRLRRKVKLVQIVMK